MEIQELLTAARELRELHRKHIERELWTRNAGRPQEERDAAQAAMRETYDALRELATISHGYPAKR